jgi:hypothetical protein
MWLTRISRRGLNMADDGLLERLGDSSAGRRALIRIAEGFAGDSVFRSFSRVPKCGSRLESQQRSSAVLDRRGVCPHVVLGNPDGFGRRQANRAAPRSYFLKGSSREGLCGVNNSAPSSVMCISSSRRMPNSPRR